MPQPVTPYTATPHGLPLGVACNNCLHRALVHPKAAQASRGTLYRAPADLSFRCRKCGQQDYETVIFREEREAKKFMAEYR